MKKNIWVIFLIPFAAFAIKGFAQKDIHLSKIVFHTSRCFGFCQAIDLKIDSNRNVIINRQVYTKMVGEEIDENASGKFAGAVSKSTYDTLIHLLKTVNINALKFSDEMCCDAPVRTMIVYYNGKRKYLKSMFPPDSAGELLSFLENIGLDNSFKRVDKIDKIEE